ncbi:MAG: glycosyltransferase, partial [Alphaproteobacteria bacterium]|nr:glycosyltransferase [Alphaproteobacteria bacterium]
TRWKGQGVLIEAMALLTDYPELYCVLLGDDQGRTEYREELEGLIRSKGLEGRVRIAPHCDDMASAYQLASVVVSASIEPEGFGRIAVESQAMGRPTIATNIGGSCETILPNETGWLVPPNDAATLAEALRIALSLSEDLQIAMAAHAMTHVRAYYTKAHMTEATLNVYREILKKTKK